MNQKRVFLIDRHVLWRMGLRALVNAQAHLTVCGESDCCSDVLRNLSARQPNLVILEPLCRTGFRTDLITKLRVLNPAPQVLAISMGEELVYAERILQAGANGFLSKDQSPEEILAGIHQVLQGEVCVSKTIMDLILRRQILPDAKVARFSVPVEKFSNRELEVFRRCGHGQTICQIAKELHLSTSTVETYQLRLREKLGMKTGAEVTHQAIRWVENLGRKDCQI